MTHPAGSRWVARRRRPIAVTADADGTLRGHSQLLGLDRTWRDGTLRLFDPRQGHNAAHRRRPSRSNEPPPKPAPLVRPLTPSGPRPSQRRCGCA